MPISTSKPCVLGSVAPVTNRWDMNREAQWLEKVMELRCSIQPVFWGRLVGFGRSVAALLQLLEAPLGSLGQEAQPARTQGWTDQDLGISVPQPWPPCRFFLGNILKLAFPSTVPFPLL